MIIICEAKATEAQIGELERTIRGAGLISIAPTGGVHDPGVIGDRNRLDMGTVTLMPGFAKWCW